MDRVSSSFHKNLLLLTKFVTPHNDFKKFFKEGMFDKPNTAGFVHVSYYLLSIYYKENLKNKVPWPVICKQTETQFRNDMRKCLTTISSEHPDINFPPILASHLLLAGGTKFILIMWKFSIVVLRTYLRREKQSIVSNAPQSGPCQELALTFLRNVTKKNENALSNVRVSRQNTQKEAEEFINKKTQEQSELKEKILKLMEDLKEIINTAPANSHAKVKLSKMEDRKIIDLWIGTINDMSQSMENNCKSLEELDELLKYINNIVANIAGNSQTLNGLNFDKINIETLYKLVPPDKQVLLYNLYQEDHLNIKSLFAIFTVLIQKCETSFQKNNLQEFSTCSEQLKTSNDQLKIAIGDYQNLHKQIETFRMEELKQYRKLNDTGEVLADAPEYAKVLFMPSPSIQIINNYEAGVTVPPNDLKLTPAESSHKDLFRKHAESNMKGIFLTKKKLSCVRIDFDDETFNDSNSFKSAVSQLQRFQTPSKTASSFKGASRYSRIFSTIRPNYNRVNNSMMTMMSTNSMLPALPQENCTSAADSCNSSQEFSQEPLLSNPNLNSTIEPAKLVEKAPPKSNKRRSISDLVERYKSLVQKRDP